MGALIWAAPTGVSVQSYNLIKLYLEMTTENTAEETTLPRQDSYPEKNIVEP